MNSNFSWKKRPEILLMKIWQRELTVKQWWTRLLAFMDTLGDVPCNLRVHIQSWMWPQFPTPVYRGFILLIGHFNLLLSDWRFPLIPLREHIFIFDILSAFSTKIATCRAKNDKTKTNGFKEEPLIYWWTELTKGIVKGISRLSSLVTRINFFNLYGWIIHYLSSISLRKLRWIPAWYGTNIRS